MAQRIDSLFVREQHGDDPGTSGAAGVVDRRLAKPVRSFYDNKTVLITGATAGFGFEMAAHLVEVAGARLVGFSQNPHHKVAELETAVATASRLSKESDDYTRRFYFSDADVGVPASVETFMERAGIVGFEKFDVVIYLDPA